MSSRSLQRQTLVGWGFLAPNIAGFLTFVLLPLVASFVMAFTNWDFRHQNIFKHEPIAFLGFGNFRSLLSDAGFWSYLKNTLYLMAGIPFSIAGSLGLALLLNRDMRGKRDRSREMLMLAAVIGAGALCLMAGGARGTALLLGIAWAAVLIGGVAGGSFTYRTLVFIPAFTNGVAVFLLWKKLYDPTNGPINAALTPVLAALQAAVLALPTWWCTGGMVVLLLLAAAVAAGVMWRLARASTEGDLRLHQVAICLTILVSPLLLDWAWLRSWPGALHATLVLIAAGVTLAAAGRALWFPPGDTLAGFLLLSLLAALAQVALLALAAVGRLLPAMAHAGLSPPSWLSSYQWAKPALIVVGFWATVGSGNMLLYLAALSNVSQDLYEAADIDGARPLARFWHVTFPQLGPTTFFIVIMSMIGGIQGGFEIARAMTNGGPAESTTTLSFFIYQLAFEDGRLGYASAAAWLLCLVVFAVTLLNWKVGSRYVND